MGQVAIDVELDGNTGAESIPLALERALRARPVGPEKLVCPVGFGAGLSWGADLLRWEA